MSDNSVDLTSNMEDYLEAIFQIIAAGKPARMKEIADSLGVQTASVTGAIRTLSDKGLVKHEPFGHVELTDAGADMARKIVRRHEVLTAFLAQVLGLDGELAERVACKMEHAIDPTVTERLVCFTEFVQACPRAGSEWLERFHEACAKGIRIDRCRECIAECKEEALGRGARGEPETTIAELEKNQRGVVVGVQGRGAIKRRLMDMGLAPGAVVEVIQVAPLGDPIEIKLKGYRLALRRDEAARVLLRLL